MMTDAAVQISRLIKASIIACAALGMVTISAPGRASQDMAEVKSLTIQEIDRMITDADFNGVAVAIASWCGPCKEELPVLAELHGKFAPKGVRIIAFSVDLDGPEAVLPLVRQLKLPFPVYWVGNPAIAQYRIRGIPLLLVIKNGQVVERIPGAQPKRKIEAVLRGLIPS